MTEETSALTRHTFLRLADTLEPLPPASWDAPSLCEHWPIREVVAHMTTAARYTTEQYIAEIQVDRGDIATTMDRIAARDGHLDPPVLLASLRDERLHRWTPPGGEEIDALTHAVVHGLDVTDPLGLDNPADEAALRAVLGRLTNGGISARFGIDLDGVRLQAADLDWSWGEGRTVTGGAADLLLLLTGRHLPADRIEGNILL